ncbi:hypothetical protein JT359_09040 [Candidatus Poribacteria bacterium]|nr:hypothetical protein [Candidatus Poribacteria bacterium]
MKLLLKDPICTIKDLNETMKLIERKLKPREKLLKFRIRRKIKKELESAIDYHNQNKKRSKEFLGLSTEKTEEIVQNILTKAQEHRQKKRIKYIQEQRGSKTLNRK